MRDDGASQTLPPRRLHNGFMRFAAPADDTFDVLSAR